MANRHKIYKIYDAYQISDFDYTMLNISDYNMLKDLCTKTDTSRNDVEPERLLLAAVYYLLSILF